MSEYVPTMERLRLEHVWLSGGENPGAREAAGEDFDAAIAAHDREIKAAAWDEAMQDAYDRGRIDQLSYEDSTNPYRIESQETP